MLLRHRPKRPSLETIEENVILPPKAQRLSAAKPDARGLLCLPFKCPGSAAVSKTSDKPARKRRKVSYVDADGSIEDGDSQWTNEDRLALANRDANKYPVYKVKDKETTFRQRFSIPLINKDSINYNPSRPAPSLGMRRGASFVARALHDPSGEFAIVLYDPTVDDKHTISADSMQDKEEKPQVKVSLMHKSLAEILGIKKQVDGERPKVPVVIDPRLAKVLRPHQVEGVKVS